MKALPDRLTAAQLRDISSFSLSNKVLLTSKRLLSAVIRPK
jgi:hypothetical protein